MPDTTKLSAPMRRPFWSLVCLLLNVNFSLSALRHRYFIEKKRRWELLLAPLVVMSFAPILSLLFWLFSQMYDVLGPVRQEASIITIGIVAAQLTALIFGIFYVISAFYFSHDLPQLVPLPLRPAQVAGAKFLVVMVNEYLTMAVMFLPPLAVYAWRSGTWLWTIPSGLIVFALLPIIPMVIAALLAVIIMRVTNVRRHRDLLRIVGALLGMGFAVGWQFVVGQMSKETGMEALANLIASRNGFIELIGEKFPPSIWATLAIARPLSLEALIGFAYFVALSAAALWLLWLAAERWFYPGLLRGGEATARKKALGATELQRRAGTAALPAALAILKREWKIFVRTPVYVLNGLVGVFIGPLILFAMLVAQGELVGVVRFFHDPEIQGWIALAAAGFVMALTAMNTVAATAISREGRYFWQSQVIPVTPGQQIQGKVLHAGILAGFAAAITFVFGIIILGIGDWYTLLAGVIIGLIGSVPVIEAGLAIDLLRPNLKWTDPQQAMKGNINGLFGMLAGVAIGGVGLGLIWVLMRFGVGEWILTGMVTSFYAVAGGAFYRALQGLAERRWREIEL